MTPAFTARRRAEEFDALVEALSTGALRDADHDAQHSRDTRYADLLEVVGALRAAPPPTPRPEFVADLRSRLMTEAQTALVAPSEPTPVRTPARTRSRERRLAAVIGGFAVVSATGSMAVAAQSALPGDTLYPLKRGIENAQVKVQSGDDDKGAALLENAAGRLDEVGELTRDGDGRAADISATLDDFSAQSTEASELLLDDYADTGRESSLEELRAFTADSLAALERLDGLVPPEARDALVEAAQTITSIDQQAVSACPACTDLPAAVSRLLVDAASLPDAIDGFVADPARTSRPDDGKGRGGPGGTDGPADPTPTRPRRRPAADRRRRRPRASPRCPPTAPPSPPPPVAAGTRSTRSSRTFPTTAPPAAAAPNSGDPLGDLVEDTTESLNDLLGG